jgi:lipopolysaccharide/colanic/teichoic acid biosynthesis glycosyltransferase
MYRDADQRLTELSAKNQMQGPMFKLEDDPRVTATGRRLRKRHLDELPQFWNVLKGEMSLVGTRPPTEAEILEYAAHHRRRLSMRPGLTGPWQVNGNHQVNDFEEVVKLDCQYIDNWSLGTDLKIVAKTLAKIVRGNAW